MLAGPGDYDPSKAKGFKADPKSGFLTGDRFNDLEREGTDRSVSDSINWLVAGHNIGQLDQAVTMFARLCA